MNEKFRTVRGYKLTNQAVDKLTSSMEDYLEMIYRFYQTEGMRVTDLAKYLNVRESSVTKMMQRLADLGLVSYKKYGTIKLTKKGEEIGGFLLSRHKIVELFLKNICLNSVSIKDVELIEHNCSLETLHSFHTFNSFLSCHPEFKTQLLDFKTEFTKSNT
ncbi:MarR family transcriptional regulator [Proteinivorax tanatarense]|uniref:MarR family transcriptional regulator n=1 Tax=Proteinivorax tanatarense TaxID=1260629 RepID=A0AAU7VP84_9FIRM